MPLQAYKQTDRRFLSLLLYHVLFKTPETFVRFSIFCMHETSSLVRYLRLPVFSYLFPPEFTLFVV